MPSTPVTRPTTRAPAHPSKPSRLRALADTLVHLLDHPDIGADEVAVFVALARYSDDRGLCHPSQSTIAGQLHRSRPWVNARLKTLADLNLLEKARHHLPKGGETSCRYRLPMLDMTTRSNPAISRPNGVHHTDTPCPGGVTMNLDSHQDKNLSLFAWAGARAEQDDGIDDREPRTGQTIRTTRPAPAERSETPHAPGADAPPDPVAQAASPITATPPDAAQPTPPTAWQPTPDDLSWAAQHRPDIDTTALTAKFLLKLSVIDPTACTASTPADLSTRWRLWLTHERATPSRPTSASTRWSNATVRRAAPPAPAARPGSQALASTTTPAPNLKSQGTTPDHAARAATLAAMIATRIATVTPGAHA